MREDTTVSWEAAPGAAAYVIVWRSTTSPIWEHRTEVSHDTNKAVLPVVADDHIFGVRSVGRLGHESRTTEARVPR
jgi:hypothetical protein